jgi:predicted transcriptional regulator
MTIQQQIEISGVTLYQLTQYERLMPSDRVAVHSFVHSFVHSLIKEQKVKISHFAKYIKIDRKKVYRMLSGEDKDQLPARWSICEDEKLIELSAKKVSQKQIANILQRTENGVCGRLYKLRNQKTGK